MNPSFNSTLMMMPPLFVCSIWRPGRGCDGDICVAVVGRALLTIIYPQCIQMLRFMYYLSNTGYQISYLILANLYFTTFMLKFYIRKNS